MFVFLVFGGWFLLCDASNLRACPDFMFSHRHMLIDLCVWNLKSWHCRKPLELAHDPFAEEHFCGNLKCGVTSQVGAQDHKFEMWSQIARSKVEADSVHKKKIPDSLAGAMPNFLKLNFWSTSLCIRF